MEVWYKLDDEEATKLIFEGVHVDHYLKRAIKKVWGDCTGVFQFLIEIQKCCLFSDFEIRFIFCRLLILFHRFDLHFFANSIYCAGIRLIEEAKGSPLSESEISFLFSECFEKITKLNDESFDLKVRKKRSTKNLLPGIDHNQNSNKDGSCHPERR